MKNAFFSFFLTLITLQGNIVENCATPHFAQNFLLFQMAIFKNIFVDFLSDLKFQYMGFWKSFLKKVSFENLKHMVFNREFQGLSKSLFGFDLAACLH